ncbi:MAG: peptidoglycan-binding domain-containing protein [Boseongicola sp.]
MENGKLAGTISLIFLGASISLPDQGHSADLFKDIVGAVVNETVNREAKAAASTNPQNTSITRDEIRRTQAALNRNGCPAGPADGIFGPKTAAAIRAYQLKNGWPATGTLTKAQRNQLLGIDPGVAAVASGLVPLLLIDGGGSVTGSSDASQGRNTAVIPSGDGSTGRATNEMTLRQQQRLKNDRGSVTIDGTNSTGTTAMATGNRDQDPNATVATGQQSLKDVLNSSAQQTNEADTDATGRKRVTSTTTTTSVDPAAQRRQLRNDRASVAAGSSGVAGSRTTIDDSVTEGDCTIARRRTGGCISQ